jgi:hypothetical protein
VSPEEEEEEDEWHTLTMRKVKKTIHESSDLSVQTGYTLHM